MGFDGFDPVELTMSVENLFGISIPDRDAERIRTPGELADYIAHRISAAPSHTACKCVSAASFYRARCILANRFGLDPKTIGPQTAIGEILPQTAKERRKCWRELSRALGVRLPTLEHSKRVQSIVGAVGFSLLLTGFAAALILLLYRPHTIAAALGLIIAGLIVPSIILAALRSRATQFPGGYETVGRISSELAEPEIEQLWQKKDEWTKHEVWEFVRWSTAKSARMSPASIDRNTSFARL